MKPNRAERQAKTGYVYKTDALFKKLDNIAEHGRFVLRNGREADTRSLANFLYKINFLTARKVLPSGRLTGSILRKTGTSQVASLTLVTTGRFTQRTGGPFSQILSNRSSKSWN